MALYLGFQDQPISATQNNELTFFTDKIGGMPNFMYGGLTGPTCCGCENHMLLVTQLYCQLEAHYYRTLYIFTCVTKSCSGKQHSWTVWRMQKKVEPESSVSMPKVKVDSPSSNWCDDSDDWGNDESANLVVMETTEDCAVKRSVEKHSCHGLDRDLKEESKLLDCAGQLKQMNLHDMEEDISLDNSASGGEPVKLPVISEPTALTNENVSNMLHLLQTESADSDSGKEIASKNIITSTKNFVSFYISSMDESQALEMSKDKHVEKLLRDYERREGSNYKDYFFAESSGVAGEKYEKTDLRHGDKTLYKFKKILALYPEQCLRYQFGGSSLLISTLPGPALSISVPPCPVCGECRVFELQLMPALASILQIEMETDRCIEFGTILIFTCRESCWQEGELFREEGIFLMQYPDHHLFKS